MNTCTELSSISTGLLAGLSSSRAHFSQALLAVHRLLHFILPFSEDGILSGDFSKPNPQFFLAAHRIFCSFSLVMPL